jgi:hypothetical protein
MSVEVGQPCPVCQQFDVKPYKMIQGYAYFECNACRSLYIDPHVLDLIDAGECLVTYNDGYWNQELQAARDRSYGSSLARVAEALLYARRDVNVFLDVGSGPGYLLDACRTYMPASAHHFYGVEKFPPPGVTTTSPNFIVGSAGDVKLTVDAGCCIEVIEHLTPRMID